MPEIDGREVCTRAELIDRYTVGLSTLQGLYRDRAATGHPEAIGKVGRSLAWDAQEWDGWYRRYRAGLTTTQNDHTHPAAEVGHDAGAHESGAHEQMVRVSGVDYSGDPDELITLTQVGRVLGLAPNTATRHATRPPDGWPEPDEFERKPDGSIYRRRYRRSTIWTYAAHRARHPGGGRPTGSTPGGRRFPYDGDPRLEIARNALRTTPTDDHARLPIQLAAEHGSAPGTWAAILTTARRHPTE